MLNPSIIRQFLFEQKRHNVVGRSMQPILRHGQTITLIPHEQTLISGHIYVFLCYGKLLMHRLVIHEKNVAVFMGDHSVRVEKVDCSAIVAKLECSYNKFLLTLINLMNKICFAVSGRKFMYALLQKIRIRCIAFLTGTF